MTAAAYLALGSNLGDRVAALRTALVLLGEMPGTSLREYSSVYETEPSLTTAEEQPVYANMVAIIDTELTPQELLAHVNMIESDLGRVRLYPNSPRTLDIDILLYGDETIDEDSLKVPHPEMMNRDFVVTPLLEVDGNCRLPDGTHVTRDSVTTGRVIGSLGKITIPA